MCSIFVGHFCPSWIRIPDPDTDWLTWLNPDPIRTAGSEILLLTHHFFVTKAYFSFSLIWFGRIVTMCPLCLWYLFLKKRKRFCLIFLQRGGSGMFIRDPGSWFLPIPDPGSKNSNKREGWKKYFCHTFLCSHKFRKIENYFSFEVLNKKNLGQFSKNYRTFYPKNCH